MACLEHECRSCYHVWHSNGPPPPCPKCGARWVTTWFDEVPEVEAPEVDE
jgi:hypothetical protein